MRRGLLVAVLLAGVGPGGGLGVAFGGTCTVLSGGAKIIADVPDPFEFISLDAFSLSVDIDASYGTFTLHRDGLAPIDADTPGGPVELRLAGPDVVGSIDAGGNVTLPSVAYEGRFAAQPLLTNQTLSTGRYSVRLNGVEYPGHGTPLDFTTGGIRLEGAALLANAPLVGSTVVWGLSLSCQLAPIPDLAALPRAATLKAVAGTAKAGKSAAGDTLKLRGTLEPGAAPFDFAHQDVFVAIDGTGADDLVLVFVRAGGLHGRGHRFTLRDSDGTVIQVLAGRKGGTDTPAPTTGNLAVTSAKRSQLKLHVSGLDLSALTGPLAATISVGPSVATTTIAVSGTGRTRRLH